MKEYLKGFFTAVCLTTSFFIFISSNNKNLGDIVVNSISIVPGKNGGGFIKAYNDQGMETTYLGTAQGGVGVLGLHSSTGKQII